MNHEGRGNPERNKEKRFPNIRVGKDMLNGERHPGWTEDAVYIGDGYMIVVDGVGSTADPQNAARVGGEAIRVYLANSTDSGTQESADELMSEAFKYAREELNMLQDNSEAVATAVRFYKNINDGNLLWVSIGCIGDVPAFVERDGVVVPITMDTTIEQYCRSIGIHDNAEINRIQRELRDNPTEEFTTFRMNNKLDEGLRGPEERTVKLHNIKLMPGDRLIILSDGAGDNLRANPSSKNKTGYNIKTIMEGETDPKRGARYLNQAALSYSKTGAHDSKEGDDISSGVAFIDKV